MMLGERQWTSRSLFTPLEQYLFSFTLGNEGRFEMTSVGNDPSKMQHDLIPTDSDWIFPQQEITRVLVERFREIPEVKSIISQLGSEEITIWTLLERYDREAREKVYTRELEICQTFRLYDFDFRVSSVDLISPEELVRAGGREIYKRT